MEKFKREGDKLIRGWKERLLEKVKLKLRPKVFIRVR